MKLLFPLLFLSIFIVVYSFINVQYYYDMNCNGDYDNLTIPTNICLNANGETNTTFYEMTCENSKLKVKYDCIDTICSNNCTSFEKSMNECWKINYATDSYKFIDCT
jgi:hypothetical protein